MEILKEITRIFSDVREQKPLIHHITNYVTAADSANIVLALGGSPVMADDQAEVEEMVSLAAALVLNIGTLNPAKVESMVLAGERANELAVPVILDPVGVGATTFRLKAIEKILTKVKPSVIKGNMSEIRFLSGLEAEIKGVDALDTTTGGGEIIAVNLARNLNCVIGITGARDIVSDGTRLCTIENGNQMLSRVTGTGCMSTSLVGTYSAITGNYFLSTAAGILTMGIAGDQALQSLKGTEGVGTFRLRLFDSVANLSENDIIKGGKVHEEPIDS